MNELCLFIKDNFWAIFAIAILAFRCKRSMYPLLIIILYQTFGYQNWYFIPLVLFAITADIFFPAEKSEPQVTATIVPVPVETPKSIKKSIQQKIDDLIPEDVPENHDINK